MFIFLYVSLLTLATCETAFLRTVCIWSDRAVLCLYALKVCLMSQALLLCSWDTPRSWYIQIPGSCYSYRNFSVADLKKMLRWSTTDVGPDKKADAQSLELRQKKIKQEENQVIVRPHWKLLQMFWFPGAQIYLLVQIQRKPVVSYLCLCLGCPNSTDEKSVFLDEKMVVHSHFFEVLNNLHCGQKQPHVIVDSLLPFFTPASLCENKHGLCKAILPLLTICSIRSVLMTGLRCLLMSLL